MLRVQLTCNSLEDLAQKGMEEVEEGNESITRFLTRDLPRLMNRAEGHLAARPDSDSEIGRVRLDLLREDHRRLRRLARDAAKALSGLRGDGDRWDAGAAAAIRRYVAAQRHQLAWYRDNLD
jgi:hypothetical protein